MNLYRITNLFLCFISLIMLFGCSLGEGGTETSVRSSGSSNSGSRSSDLGSDGASSTGSNSSSDSSMSAFESKAFNLVNEYRATKGLSPLSLDTEISNVSRGHSANMSNGSVAFGHDGFTERGTVLQASVGWAGIAENVAYNGGFDDPATVAVNGWIGSPGHEVNMTGNYTKTGMGVAISSNGSYYFTQIFIK